MPLTYREALDLLISTGSRGVKVGLARTEALLAALGHPEAGLRGVLVAGTNGKGSVCALVESACRAAGLRTVLLVKPHLRSYRERIVLDGEPVSAGTFATLLERALPAMAAVEASTGAPTQFEILTALGLLAARDHSPDVVICEVGLGGRLDSTNVLDLGVAAVTTVDLDHREFLGDTVEQIAAEKAGIIKAGDDLVTGVSGPALEVIGERAAQVGVARTLALGDGIRHAGRSLGLEGVEAEVHVADLVATLRVPLVGAFQADNAAVAAAILVALRDRGLPIDGAAIGAGFAAVRWPARLQWIPGAPALIVDGAHNPAAIRAIVPAVRDVVGERPLVLLVGAMADKDTAGMLDALRPLQAPPVFTQPGTMRAARAVDLARAWGVGARAISSLPDALTAARLLAGGEGVVLTCGSLYLAGDVLALVSGGAD